MADEEQASASEVRDRAVRLLARREHAPIELERKLVQRGFERSLVRAVLDELIEENLLSSQRYAESMVRVRIEGGRGPLRIRDELAGNDIAQAQIEQAMDLAQADWCALARAVRAKRFGADLPADFPAKAKQMRFLQQRGFAMEQIQAAVAMD